MIEWVYRRASRARSVEGVMVATDDQRISRVVERFGGHAVLTSRQHPSGTDRIAEVAKRLRCSAIVNVQGDEPLIDPRAIDTAVAGLLASRRQCPVSTLMTPIRRLTELEDPNVVKVVTNERQEAVYFSRSIVPHWRGKDLRQIDFAHQRSFFKHLGLYVYTRAFLLRWPELQISQLEKLEALEQLRVLENGYRIKVLVTPFSSPSVDTPEDVQIVEEEIARRKIRF